MIKNIFLISLFFLQFSCNDEKVKNTYNSIPFKIKNIDDLVYIRDSSFVKGDVRRYGVYPNKNINSTYLKNILTLANKGLPITFPKGYYNTNLILKGIKNVQINFDNVILSGSLEIREQDSINSFTINLHGDLTILDKLFIRKSAHINFENITVLTDTTLNINHKKNRGVSIYAGSKNIHFNNLIITDVGGDADKYYQHSAASLQIHGWKNNPKSITINNLVINNSARTALYITGKNHKIKKVKIFNFGLGSDKNIFGLEDAKPNSKKKFTAFWMNRCDFCEIDSLEVNSITDKGKYSLRLDEGVYSEPSFIYNISIKNKAKYLPILDDELTNILIKNEY